jgi:hypothetical protein
MAGKKKKKSTKAIEPKDNADTVVVQRAYEDSLKESLATYFLACGNDPKEAEENFLAGLSIMRDARDRALQLVQADSACAPYSSS